MEHALIPLAVYNRAPSFSLPGSRATTLPLCRPAGSSVVIAFLPAVSDPVSREQLTLYQEFLPEVTILGAQMLVISTDSIEDLDASTREAALSFPLVSDSVPHGAVCRLYGVYREREEVSARALFVLDPSHTIRFGRAYPNLLNPGVDDILTVLER